MGAVLCGTSGSRFGFVLSGSAFVVGFFEAIECFKTNKRLRLWSFKISGIPEGVCLRIAINNPLWAKGSWGQSGSAIISGSIRKFRISISTKLLRPHFLHWVAITALESLVTVSQVGHTTAISSLRMDGKHGNVEQNPTSENNLHRKFGKHENKYFWDTFWRFYRCVFWQWLCYFFQLIWNGFCCTKRHILYIFVNPILQLNLFQPNL